MVVLVAVVILVLAVVRAVVVVAVELIELVGRSSTISSGNDSFSSGSRSCSRSGS